MIDISPIWYVLIGFVLGQFAVLLAMYIGELLHHDDELS